MIIDYDYDDCSAPKLLGCLLIFQENRQHCIFRSVEKIIHRFRFFSVKCLPSYQRINMTNGIRIEHFVDIFLIPQRWQGQSLPDLRFVHVDFNIPSYQTNTVIDLDGNVSDEKTNRRISLSRKQQRRWLCTLHGLVYK